MKDWQKKMSTKHKVIRNAAQCRKCGDVIESKGVHDFRWCSCHSIFVDGGQEYIRRGGKAEDIIELSEEIEIEGDTE